MRAEHDTDEAEYGAWEFTAEDALNDERKLFPRKRPEDIWPHWSEGVPTTLRRTWETPPFSKNGVRHKPNLFTERVDLCWRHPRAFFRIEERFSFVAEFQNESAVERRVSHFHAGKTHRSLGRNRPDRHNLCRVRRHRIAKLVHPS
jgi:hypothetical protein